MWPMSCLTMHFCHAFSYHISCHFNVTGPVKLVSMWLPDILLTCETMPYPEKSELQSDPGFWCFWFHFNKASLAHKSRLLHAESMESSCSLCNLTGETLCNEAMTMNDHGVDDWNDWKIEKVCPSKCLVLVRCWSAAAWDNSPDVNRVQKNNLLSYAMPQASDA